MRIDAAMYLDHNEVIGYPVEYVMRSLVFADRVHLFASDDTNLRALVLAAEGVGVRFVTHPVLGFHIKTPGDISRMMNHAVTVAKNDTWDFLVLAQADTLATSESCKAVEWFAKPANLARALHLDCEIGMLHHYSGGGWGHTIVGHTWEGHFHGDGSGKEASGADIPRLHLENRHDFGYLGLVNLEIGSLGVDYYYRHIRQHVQTWNEDWLLGARVRTYDAGQRDEFIKMSLRDLRTRIHKTRPLTDVTVLAPRYNQVLDDLGLRAEHERIIEIGREVDRKIAYHAPG